MSWIKTFWLFALIYKKERTKERLQDRMKDIAGVEIPLSAWYGLHVFMKVVTQMMHYAGIKVDMLKGKPSQ